MGLSNVPSREEINIKRLLLRCEEMSKVKHDGEEPDWRLEKYIESLEEMIKDISTKPHKPSVEAMCSYNKRLNFLKSFILVQNADNPLDKVKAFQTTHKAASSSENREVEFTVSESVHSELREELFSKSDNTLRKRGNLTEGKDDTTDLDELLKYHHIMQEKIADNMLVLARNIKEQSLVAGNIIRNDSLNVEKSAMLADKNIDHLKIQSEKLQESTRKTSHCWIWVLVIVVFVVFFNMVLLMKITKKK